MAATLELFGKTYEEILFGHIQHDDQVLRVQVLPHGSSIMEHGIAHSFKYDDDTAYWSAEDITIATLEDDFRDDIILYRAVA